MPSENWTSELPQFGTASCLINLTVRLNPGTMDIPDSIRKCGECQLCCRLVPVRSPLLDKDAGPSHSYYAVYLS